MVDPEKENRKRFKNTEKNDPTKKLRERHSRKQRDRITQTILLFCTKYNLTKWNCGLEINCTNYSAVIARRAAYNMRIADQWNPKSDWISRQKFPKRLAINAKRTDWRTERLFKARLWMLCLFSFFLAISYTVENWETQWLLKSTSETGGSRSIL